MPMSDRDRRRTAEFLARLRETIEMLEREQDYEKTHEMSIYVHAVGSEVTYNWEKAFKGRDHTNKGVWLARVCHEFGHAIEEWPRRAPSAEFLAHHLALCEQEIMRLRDDEEARDNRGNLLREET